MADDVENQARTDARVRNAEDVLRAIGHDLDPPSPIPEAQIEIRPDPLVHVRRVEDNTMFVLYAMLFGNTRLCVGPAGARVL